jgi:transposase-like protein
MKRKVNQFPDELKFKVVQEYLQTDLSVKELMQKHGIRGNSCIINWMRKFGLSYPTEDQIKINNQVAKEINKTPQEQELEQKLKALEKDLAYEKLRTKALNTMIDIAEKELKISIRKKSGAKQ